MTAGLRAIALLFGLLAALPAAAEQEFTTLEERMTGKEFNEAGLHKLTPGELEALNRWIRQRSLAEYVRESADTAADSDATVDRRGLPAERTGRDPIESYIVGSFTGWNGEEEFELGNGMVWRQIGSDTFYIPEVENPEVIIRPGLMGSWQLQVVGHNRRVRVERIR